MSRWTLDVRRSAYGHQGQLMSCALSSLNSSEIPDDASVASGKTVWTITDSRLRWSVVPDRVSVLRADRGGALWLDA